MSAHTALTEETAGKNIKIDIELQLGHNLLENCALRAFCPSPPLCNVDLTLFM